jgi:hypothetical protein
MSSVAETQRVGQEAAHPSRASPSLRPPNPRHTYLTLTGRTVSAAVGVRSEELRQS